MGWMEQITPQFSLDKDEIIDTGTGLEGKEADTRKGSGTGNRRIKRLRLEYKLAGTGSTKRLRLE